MYRTSRSIALCECIVWIVLGEREEIATGRLNYFPIGIYWPMGWCSGENNRLEDAKEWSKKLHGPNARMQTGVKVAVAAITE